MTVFPSARRFPRLAATLLLLLLYILGTLGYALFRYAQEERHFTHLLHTRLMAVANDIPLVLGEHYHDRLPSPDALDKGSYLEKMDRLTALCRHHDIAFAYTLVQKEGAIRFVASSYKTDDPSKRDGIASYYLQPFEQPKPALAALFSLPCTPGKSVRERWGGYYAVWSSRCTPQGVPYVIGTDTSVDTLRQIRRNAFEDATWTSLFFALLLTPLAGYQLWILEKLGELHVQNEQLLIQVRITDKNHFNA